MSVASGGTASLEDRVWGPKTGRMLGCHRPQSLYGGGCQLQPICEVEALEAQMKGMFVLSVLPSSFTSLA